MGLRNIFKKVYVGAIAAALVCALSGCMIVSSPDELFSLPKLPEEYVDLERQIEALMNNGYEYAAPTGGENVQLVQMVDLDSDHIDEAVVFLRKATDAKPQKICVFQNLSGGYHPVAMIEESASSISYVEYCDMNNDGNLEIIVGWRMMGVQDANVILPANTTELALTRVVSVYNMERYACQKILETNYNQYNVMDLDYNGVPELIVIAGNSNGNCDAAVYQWNMGALDKKYTVRLSVPPAMLREVYQGGLQGGATGLFVTGVIDEQTLVTDILVLSEDGFKNCTMNEQTGISNLIYRESKIDARDINSDGVLELPISYELKKKNPKDFSNWGISWTAFSETGKAQVVENTYHNLTDGWYLVLPESWKDLISITDISSTPGERAITFGIYRKETDEPLNILTIYTETGDSREYKASKGKRFVLLREAATIYAAEFAEDSQYWTGTMTREALEAGFHIIGGSNGM